MRRFNDGFTQPVLVVTTLIWFPWQVWDLNYNVICMALFDAGNCIAKTNGLDELINRRRCLMHFPSAGFDNGRNAR